MFWARAAVRAEDLQTEILKAETVTSRPRPELDPLGIRLDSFMVFPSLTLDQSYNDNIYATPSADVADTVTTVAEKMVIRSDWENHQLGTSVTNTNGIYAGHAGEDYDDLVVTGNGRLDLDRNDTLNADTSYSNLHEPRTSPDNTFGKTPTLYSLEQVHLGSFDSFNWLAVNLDAKAAKYEYTDVATSLDNFIAEKDRNRTEYTVSTRFGYEIVPNYEAVLRSNLTDYTYEHPVDSAGYRRSSRGAEGSGGIAFDLSGVTFGEVGVGYLLRDYADPRFGVERSIAGKAALTWNVTTLITVKANASRSLEETVVVGSSSFVATGGNLNVDWELLRFLLLNAQFSMSHDDYQQSPRRDSILSTGFGATYMMNRYANIAVTFSHMAHNSNEPLFGFTQNIAMVHVLLQL